MNARWVGPLILVALMITGGCASVPVGGTSVTVRSGSSFAVNDTTYHPLKSAKGFRQVGLASWYGRQHAGRRTSSGEPYNPYQLTAAHKSLPMNTRVKITNLENGKSVVVRINDRGPFARDRVIDLSYAAARKIGVLKKGIVRVRIVALSGIKNSSPLPARRTVRASIPSKKVTLRVDFIWPLEGRVTSRFGRRGRRNHTGIDIDATTGARIRAVGDGVVTHSGWGRNGYGRTVIVKHYNGLQSVYAHNLRNLVEKGQKVRQGQIIALVGSSGWTTGSHLHFEIRKGDAPQNPLVYLPGSAISRRVK